MKKELVNYDPNTGEWTINGYTFDFDTSYSDGTINGIARAIIEQARKHNNVIITLTNAIREVARWLATTK